MKQEVFFKQGKQFFFDDRARVAEYVKANCAQQAEQIIAVANDVVNQKFLFNLRWDMERTYSPVVFEGDIDWLHQPGDDPEWIYAFNRMRFWICLGQAYALTGDEKYAQAFAKQLCSWVDTVKKDDPKNQLAWRTIEAGLRMEYWLKAMCYFEGSPAITDEVMEKFLNSMTEHAEYIMGVYNSYNLMSNWGVLANHGLFLAGVMLPSTPRTAEYRAEALRRLTQEITIQVYEDGMQWEQSPMYHNEVAHDYLDVVILARRNGITLPEVLEKKTHDMCLVDLYGQKPDGNEVSMGDSDEIDVRDIVSKGAYLYHDAELKWGGYERFDFDCIWDLGIEAANEYAALEAKAPKKTAHALHSSGNYYFRSDWGRDASFLHFHCGTLGAGHGHSDQLHFDLFSRGEDILIDAGRYTYVDKPERYEFKDSTAHNTCTVDGRNFYVCQDSWGCSKLSRAVNQKFADCGKYGYAEGGHLGYYDLETGGVFVNRRIVTIDSDLYVVADEFYAGNPHTYRQYFHFNNLGSVSGSGDRFVYSSTKNRAEICLVGNHRSAVLTPTRLSRHYNLAEDNVTLQTELAGNGFTSAFTVISLNPAGEGERVEVEKVPVYSNFKEIQFEDRLIEALTITKGARRYTVVVAHQEYASPTDTFRADGCTGFGNVVVFDRAAGETTVGKTLVW
ncbi:MAG TPA: heparinase [Clostridiales bacterium]|nr:heparinase [Clostridiales bacterium]